MGGVDLPEEGVMKKAVVITGASTGIGEACARYLDARGWRVFAGVRKDADAERLRDGTSIEPVRLDVTDSASIAATRKSVEEAVSDHGIAGLVNNAGIAVAGPLEYVPLDALRTQLEVNVVGQVAVTQAFLPLLRMRRGRIVFIGSVSGLFAAPFVGPYSASKHALEAIADSLRVELRPWKIAVSLIEPGPIATPLWERARTMADELFAAMPPEAIERYGAVVPIMQRITDQEARNGLPPEEVAEVVAHALTSSSPRTRYLMGPFESRVRARLGRFVPDRIRDTLIVRATGLPG